MATTKNARKTARDTGKGAKGSEIDTSAPANDTDAKAGETSEPPKGDEASKASGDPTGRSGPVINTGASALPNANRQAPVARVVVDPKAKTKEVFLDQPYMLHGRLYPASKHPHDLITVPEDFPEHVLPLGGKAPSLDEWRPGPESAVVEIPDESAKQL